MHNQVSFNRQIGPVEAASISAISSAALYGGGIFTTIAVYDGTPFLWEKHWRRLIDNARKLSIDLTEFSEDDVTNALAKIIEKNQLVNGRARITFFNGSAGDMWKFENIGKTSLLITTADLRKIPAGLRLTVSPFRINSASPLAGVKSCNYLEKILVLDDARSRGFDECVCLNEHSEIASAVMANLFWLTDGKLYTPSLKTGCLAGTTREFVLENINCEEVETALEALRVADAIYLTSAGIGILQASAFETLKFKPVPHEILYLSGGSFR